MSVILNSPVHFYKPVECSTFVHGAPVVRSILLEKDAVETGKEKVRKRLKINRANFTMWP